MFRVNLDNIRAAAINVKSLIGFSPKGITNSNDKRRALLLFIALFFAVMPMEISHLVSACIGALGYLLLDKVRPSLAAGPTSSTGGKVLRGPIHGSTAPWTKTGGPPGCQPIQTARGTGLRNPAPKVEVRKPSAMPVSAPRFCGVGWEAEVDELLAQIVPTREGDRVVAHIARLVKRTIAQIVPDAEVTGFAHGNLMSCTAYGVAVPEVDIVIKVSPSALLGHLQGRWSHTRSNGAKLDARKLQKSAIRACTDKLVGTGTFKFRRSAFRGQEPKVTLIAPAGLGLSDQGVPLNLSVNAVTPLQSAALLAECTRLEPLTRELVLLVRRWAKDRGLCHAAQGHLPPYAWALLAVYFLQVGVDGPLLPSLEGLELCPGLTVRGGPVGPRQWCQHADRAASAGSLFKGFLRFYTWCFDWRNEAVSVRMGRRSPPDLSLPLHIILHDDGSRTEVGPSIEDPFQAASNLGSCMTASSLKRLHEEFQRADGLCAAGASLTRLLEPWAPPEVAADLAAEPEEDEDGGQRRLSQRA